MTNESRPYAMAYRKGSGAACSIFAVAYGLKTLGVSDLWCVVACLALSTALIVGMCGRTTSNTSG